MTTIYSIASKEDIEQILSSFNLIHKPGWPTIIAKKGDRIEGFLSTQENKNIVIAGPFEAESPQIALRLISAYEAILRGIGLSTYWFHVERNNEKWLDMVRRSQTAVLIEEDDNGYWFQRDLRLH